jgi:tRNA (cytidine/uridine-2'-O-)-methyltransferase
MRHAAAYSIEIVGGNCAPMRLALFEPDIPQNAGTMMRMAACLGVALDVIEPCGFTLNDRSLRRAGMDYLEQLDLSVHQSWDVFLAERAAAAQSGRLILLSTRGSTSYTDCKFALNDTLMVGRESAGAPPEVHAAADKVITIPMRGGARSLNVAVAAAMVLGEALRQNRAGQL